MSVQSQIFNIEGGGSRTFLSTKPILQKQNLAVWLGLDDGLNVTWSQMAQQQYDLINNAVVIKESFDLTIYSFIEIRVADTPDEIIERPTDISTIAPYVNEIKTVADNIADVASVGHNIAYVQVVSDDITSVKDVSVHMQEVIDAPTAAENAALSADAAEQSHEGCLNVLQDVTTEGNIQTQRIIDEGDNQVQTIKTEGNAQAQRVGDEGDIQYEIVNTEGGSQYRRIQTEGDNQVQRVKTEGDNQYTRVKTEGDNQYTRVEAVGNSKYRDIVDEGDTQYNRVHTEGEAQFQAIVDEGDTQTQRVTTAGDEAYIESRVAEAEAMTSDSYANQPQGAYVRDYYYDESTDSILYNEVVGRYSAFHWSLKAAQNVALRYQGSWDSLNCALPPTPAPTGEVGSDVNGYLWIVKSVTGDTSRCSDIKVGDWLIWEGDDPATPDTVEGEWAIISWTFDWSAIANVPNNVANAVNRNGDTMKGDLTMTTSSRILSRKDDDGIILQSLNNSAGGAVQFELKHNRGEVEITNQRGAITVFCRFLAYRTPSNDLEVTNKLYVDTNFAAKGFEGRAKTWADVGMSDAGFDGLDVVGALDYIASKLEVGQEVSSYCSLSFKPNIIGIFPELENVTVVIAKTDIYKITFTIIAYNGNRMGYRAFYNWENNLEDLGYVELMSKEDGLLKSEDAYINGLLYKGDLDDTSDVDDYTLEAGIYSTSGAMNMPEDTDGMLYVARDRGDRVYQRYELTGYNNDPVTTYERRGLDDRDGWTEWVKVVNSAGGEINGQLDLTNSVSLLYKNDGTVFQRWATADGANVRGQFIFEHSSGGAKNFVFRVYNSDYSAYTDFRFDHNGNVIAGGAPTDDAHLTRKDYVDNNFLGLTNEAYVQGLLYKGEIPADGDLNDYQTAGVYMGDGTLTYLNCPTDADFVLTVKGNGADRFYQTVEERSNRDNQNNKVWTRAYATSWSPWTQVVNSAGGITVDNNIGSSVAPSANQDYTNKLYVDNGLATKPTTTNGGSTVSATTMMTLTQAEYDAIATPDANTLYLIVG